VAQLRQSVSRTPHIWLVVLALAAGACGSDTPAGPSPGDPTAIAVTCTPTAQGHDCRASLQRTSGPAQDVTTTATWTSSNTAVATVDAAGHVTHRGSGQAEIRATYQDLFGGAIILVNISISSLSVTCLPDGSAYACTAIASFSNGTSTDVSRSGAAWSTSNAAIATVDSTGRVTPLANGQVEIAARFQSVVGGVVLTLSGVVTVTSVTVACTPEFEAHQCAATAHLSNGTTQDVTSQATWTSSNTAVATVTSTGFVRHRTTGQTEIRAVYRNITGSAVLDIVVTLSGASVVINEFATRGPGDGSTDDFVELRNDSSSPVDISGWRVNEWGPTFGVRVAFVVPNGVVVAPGCHYLVTARPDVGGIPPDLRMSPINDQGGIALLHANNSIVDQVGYHPDSVYREGTPMPLPGPEDTRSYTRVGNDTNNNINDFVRQSRTPLNSSASCSIR
jgi:uncharacterized protein YjdB